MTFKITSSTIVFEIALFLLLFSFQINAQNKILNNGLRRIGDGIENSINSSGNMQQPFYYNAANNPTWTPLTYSDYPLDIRWGVGGESTANWNLDGVFVDNPPLSNINNNSPGFTPATVARSEAGGTGVIKVSGNISINGQSFIVENQYTLGMTDGFIRVKTKITNNSGSLAKNVRLWVGTRDDWIGNVDDPTKERGNLVDGAFTVIDDPTKQAKAIKVYSGDEAILMFSNSPRAYSTIAGYGPFSNATNTDPSGNTISIQNDGSYAVYARFNDLANGQSDELDWYYAAGTVSEIQEIIQNVALAAAGVVSNISYTTADFSYTASQSGTTSYVLVAAGSTVPTAAQIKARTSYTGGTVISSGTATTNANAPDIFYLTGLTHNTNYTLYGVTEYNSNVFTSVTSTNFTTLLSPLVAPTISGFNALNKLFFDDSFTIVPPTTNSEGAITYTSSDPAVATINGTTVTILSAGSTTITAYLAETGTHTSGSVNALLTVNSVDVLTRKGKKSPLDKIDYMDANGKKGGNRGLTRFGEIKITKSN